MNVTGSGRDVGHRMESQWLSIVMCNANPGCIYGIFGVTAHCATPFFVRGTYGKYIPCEAF